MTLMVQPHYSIIKLDDERGMEQLRALFPDGEANDLNFCLFSTSGVHGAYTTIEAIEAGADDHLTVVVVHPRIVCMRYGHIKVAPEDIPFLKKLRASSFAALAAQAP